MTGITVIVLAVVLILIVAAVAAAVVLRVSAYHDDLQRHTRREAEDRFLAAADRFADAMSGVGAAANRAATQMQQTLSTWNRTETETETEDRDA